MSMIWFNRRPRMDCQKEIVVDTPMDCQKEIVVDTPDERFCAECYPKHHPTPGNQYRIDETKVHLVPIRNRPTRGGIWPKPKDPCIYNELDLEILETAQALWLNYHGGMDPSFPSPYPDNFEDLSKT